MPRRSRTSTGIPRGTPSGVQTVNLTPARISLRVQMNRDVIMNSHHGSVTQAATPLRSACPRVPVIAGQAPCGKVSTAYRPAVSAPSQATPAGSDGSETGPVACGLPGFAWSVASRVSGAAAKAGQPARASRRDDAHGKPWRGPAFGERLCARQKNHQQHEHGR